MGEMLVHPALCCAPRPRKALVIGGGDGGVLRELVKHPLDEILVVDIDRDVVGLCRKYLPALSGGAFDDYSPEIHLASMVIPGTLEKTSKGGRTPLPDHGSEITGGKTP